MKISVDSGNLVGVARGLTQVSRSIRRSSFVFSDNPQESARLYVAAELIELFRNRIIESSPEVAAVVRGDTQQKDDGCALRPLPLQVVVVANDS